MTPPGGSRDGGAGDDPRRHAEPGQSGSGATVDAGEGEPGVDPSLHAMRAVWLAMRDADPPDRGLAELLAAARRKAEAMQPRPTAWQRLLAAMRRPPALALATAMVLIAGAALIGRRVPNEPDRGATNRRPPSESGSGAPAPHPAAPATAAHGGALAQPPSPVPESADSRSADTSALPVPATGHRSTPAPAPRTTAPHAEEPTGEDRDAADPVPSVSGAPASEQPPSGTATRLGASAAVPSVDTTSAVGPRKPPAPPPPAPAPPASPAPGDLYRQCEAAARRGDCAAVRRMLGQIARTDPGYRARIAKDSPVAECLTK